MKILKYFLFILFFIFINLFNIQNTFAADIDTINGVPINYAPIERNYSQGVTIIPEYIIIHDTGNRSPSAYAINNRNYFNKEGSDASTQFIVDDHEIVQALPETAKAWHIGDGHLTGASNDNSIGIELCVNSDGDFSKTFQTGIALTKYLMNKYSIPPDRVIRHFDATGKICPRIMIEDDPTLWTKFKNSLYTKEENEENDIDKTNEDNLTEESEDKKEENKYIIPFDGNGRVINNDIEVKSQPSKDVETIGYIGQGNLVKVLESCGNNFCKINYNGLELYVEKENISLFSHYKYDKNDKVVKKKDYVKKLISLCSFNLIDVNHTRFSNI